MGILALRSGMMRGSLLLLPLMLTAAGCRIARTSANDAVARLDTAWIVPERQPSGRS